MALASTTLSGAKAINQTALAVTTTTGMVRGKMVRVDNEFFRMTADASGTNVPVLCGQEGSAQTTHVAGAVVQWGDPSDFATSPAGTATPVPVAPVVVHQTVTTATGGTIVLPNSSQGVFLTVLGTVTTAQTLTDPTYAQEGQEVTIQAGAAHAYIVQAVDSVGVASDISFSGDQDIATFGGAIGDDFKIKAVNGAWQVIFLHNVTLSDT